MSESHTGLLSGFSDPLELLGDWIRLRNQLQGVHGSWSVDMYCVNTVLYEVVLCFPNVADDPHITRPMHIQASHFCKSR